MNFICNKDLLVKKVSNASKAILPKTIEGVLDSVYIEANENSLTITGYNMEFGITDNVKADVITQGKMIVSAKIFLEIIKKMPGDKISVIMEDQKCVIRSEKTEYAIMSGNVEDYPELPQIGDMKEISVESGILKSMIGQTIFAVAIMDSKPVFTGALFDINEGKINMVATDGSRIAIRTEKIDTKDKFYFVVPGKALSELEKLIEDNEEKIIIELGKEHVIFRLGEEVVISRLLDGDFLSYRQCIPAEWSTDINISTKELIDSIERTSLIIHDRIKNPIRMNFLNDKITISCSTALGKSYDEIDCTANGKEIEIGFNSRFVLDVLRASQSENVVVKLRGSTSPMCIVPEEGDKFLFLVLPTRL